MLAGLTETEQSDAFRILQTMVRVTSLFTGQDAGNAQPSQTTQPYSAYRFNAMRWDSGTGQYDMGFRTYDPALNQFTSRDMYTGALANMGLATDPFTGSSYAFGQGNPVTNIEYNGHVDLTSTIPSAISAIQQVTQVAQGQGQPLQQFPGTGGTTCPGDTTITPDPGQGAQKLITLPAPDLPVNVGDPLPPQLPVNLIHPLPPQLPVDNIHPLPPQLPTNFINVPGCLGSAMVKNSGSAAGDDAGVRFTSDTSHIFRNAPGHLAQDTAENRALIKGAVSAANLRETITLRDGSTLAQYFETLPNGTQVWAEVRNGTEITNGGLNATPR